MIDILLVNARCNVLGKKSRLEHLGLGYLSSMLQSHGRSVQVVDANYFDQSAEDVASHILATPSRAVGFGVFLNNARETGEIIEKIRTEGDRRHVVLGGHHATFHHDEILTSNDQVDSILLGETEISLLELVDRLVEGIDWKSVPGLASRRKDGYVDRNVCPPLITDLDSLPFPDRDPYAESLRKHKLATILSSRGCQGRCTYCSIRAFYDLAKGPSWRPRSPEAVVDEMEYVARRYGVTHFEFADDNLIGPGRRGRQRARRIGEQILERGLDIRFFFICRADCIDEELLLFLKMAGLEGVDIGIESWVSHHLELYNKQLTVEDNRRAVATLQKLDLAKRFYLIPSNPYCTIEEMLENLEQVEAIGLRHFPDSAVFNRLTVFKGSRLEKKLRAEGLLLPHRPDFRMGGPLEYEFVHPIMKRVHDSTDRIFQEYLNLARVLDDTFRTPECQPVEAEFAEDARLCLRRTTFDLLRETLDAFRRGDEQSVPAMIDAALAPLEDDLTEITTAHQRGDFHQFRDMEFRLGAQTATYPPVLVRDLTELFLKEM